MYSKKILFSILFIMGILIGVLIPLFSISRAFQWNHSENQVPFDGYYANYSGWYYDFDDPFNNTLPIYNFELHILYFDINSLDYLMEFNMSIHIYWSGIWGSGDERAVYNGSVVLTNRTVINKSIIEGSITAPNMFDESLFQFGDLLWCLNNLSIGDSLMPKNEWADSFILEIVNYKGFFCYHGKMANNNIIADIYYDSYSGGVIGFEGLGLFPQIKNLFSFSWISGNLSRESHLTTIWIVAGVMVGLLGIIIALRYRTNIKAKLLRKKKDMKRKSFKPKVKRSFEKK